jgi:peptidoglycan/xylan/chitin deacetylase (PgdA/CDA1 family)
MNRLWAVIATLFSALAVAAYLVLPGMWQWNRAEALAATTGGRQPVVQVDTIPPPSDPALVEKLRNLPTSAQAPPLILTYHDIGHTRDRYTVTPEAFASQMQLIHDAGWTTLTADDLSNWLAGTPLPPHSVFITFDDGTRGVWQYADPVLKRFGLHATAFIITGFVGTHQPYYMTWDQIEELHASGRWGMEAHTHVGHVQVPSDATGKEGAFLTTAMWLPALGRVETDEEYRNRIAGDLTESKRQLILHGLPEPHFLAYPFSAHEDASNPERAAILSDVVRPLFEASLLDQADVTAVTTADNVAAGNLNRMDVTVEVNTEKWVDKLAAASPYDPVDVRPLLDGGGWTDSNQRPTEMVSVAEKHVIIDPGPGQSNSVQYARFHTPMWSTYKVSADLGFDPDVPGTSTGVTVFTGSARHEVDVSVDRGYFSIFVGNTGASVRSGDLPDQPTYHVEVAATPTGVAVTIDGMAVEPLVFDPAPPWEIAGGIGLLSHRDSAEAPVSVVSNLEVH